MKNCIILFLLFFYTVSLSGQQEINLSKIPFETENVGKKLKDAFVKYHKLAASKSDCSNAYANVLEPFQEIDSYCDKNITYGELKKVVRNLRAIDKVKADSPTCFDEDFKAYQDVLINNSQTIVETENKNLKEHINTRNRETSSENGLFYWFGLLAIIIILGGGFLAYKKYEEDLIRITQMEYHNKQTTERLENQIALQKKLKEQKDKSEREKIAAKELQERVERQRIALVQLAESRRLEAERFEKEKQYEKERIAQAQFEKEKIEKQRLVEIQLEENRKLEAEREAKKLEKIYIYIPIGDREFSNNPHPNYINGRTYYKFFVSNGFNAEFELCPEAFTFVIDKPQTHILPVCTPINTRQNNVTSIKTIQRGEAHLKGDKWIVNKKATIEYVSIEKTNIQKEAKKEAEIDANTLEGRLLRYKREAEEKLDKQKLNQIQLIKNRKLELERAEKEAVERTAQAELAEKQKLQAERFEKERIVQERRKLEVEQLSAKVTELNNLLTEKQKQLIRIEQENSDLKKQQTQVAQLSKENEQLKVDLRLSKKDIETPEISKLQAHLLPMKLENEQLKLTLSQQKDALIAKALEVEKPNLKDFFYMSIPIRENYFSHDNRLDYYMPNRIFYRFFTFNNGEATFEFCNEPKARELSMEKPYTHLLSACEETNTRKKGVKQIRTIKRGKAVIQDNLWQVVEKAKIEYLY